MADEALGILCALPAELGSLRERQAGPPRRHRELELLPLDLEGTPALACVGGVGKVLAARAATVLVAEGARRALLVVGVAGGLRPGLRAGELVHCTRAVQADLALRGEREQEPAAELLERWREVAPGRAGWFLTADRPALSIWRRVRLARAFLGAAVADMETAAVAAVAAREGVPWAALRAVTDGLWPGGTRAFPRHFPGEAGRAADTVPALTGRFGRA